MPAEGNSSPQVSGTARPSGEISKLSYSKKTLRAVGATPLADRGFVSCIGLSTTDWTDDCAVGAAPLVAGTAMLVTGCTVASLTAGASSGVELQAASDAAINRVAKRFNFTELPFG